MKIYIVQEEYEGQYDDGYYFLTKEEAQEYIDWKYPDWKSSFYIVTLNLYNAGWKKITDKSDLEGKYVIVKTDNKYIRDNHYSVSWDHDNNRWEFMDGNWVSCREWNGEPTHYQLINE